MADFTLGSGPFLSQVAPWSWGQFCLMVGVLVVREAESARAYSGVVAPARDVLTCAARQGGPVVSAGLIGWVYALGFPLSALGFASGVSRWASSWEARRCLA